MISICDMKPQHLDAVYAIELNSFSIPWSKNELQKELSNKHAVYKVAIINGVKGTSPLAGGKVHWTFPGAEPHGLKIAGYIGMWHIVNEGHITNLAVDEPYRRMGVGSMLLEALIDLAVEREMIGLTLEVRMGNTAAQKLYTKYGFKPEGIRKNYYSDTREDAVIMWKYL